MTYGSTEGLRPGVSYKGWGLLLDDDRAAARSPNSEVNSPARLDFRANRQSSPGRLNSWSASLRGIPKLPP